MANTETFLIRQAIERLRCGLFDPLAVERLTIEEDRIKKTFLKDLASLEKQQADYLCLCGSYGQGKSHNLMHMHQQALASGFATSFVQLDIKETPFHKFSLVYQAIMKNLVLPDGKKIIQAWKQFADKECLQNLDTLPHRFRMILTALLCKNKQLTPKEKALKKYRDYRPREYENWLEKALMGYNVPSINLKGACKYRQLEGYRKYSLVCRGNIPYIQVVESLGQLLQKMGYKGLVLFFDEAESIAQVPLGNRAKSYAILDHFFQNNSYIYPIFAFTEDFFDKVHAEQYVEKKVFLKDYAKAWQKLNIIRLCDLNSCGWSSLLDRLIQLYEQAYQIIFPDDIRKRLLLLLQTIEAQETRYKLKALIHYLDMESQKPIVSG